jgi:hypothetical protein
MFREKLLKVIKRLEHNNFEVYFAHDTIEATDIFRAKILDKIVISSASYGDSATMMATGALELLK